MRRETLETPRLKQRPNRREGGGRVDDEDAHNDHKEKEKTFVFIRQTPSMMACYTC